MQYQINAVPRATSKFFFFFFFLFFFFFVDFFSPRNSHSYLGIEPSHLKIELARDIMIPNNCVKYI